VGDFAPAQPIQPKALVVDDEEVLRSALVRALTRAGFEVQSAADGQAALRALQDDAFDVILSDIDMPRMNGIQLLDAARAHDLDVPVVLITGSPSLSTAISATEHGALRYLLKPVAHHELVSVARDAALRCRLARSKRQALELAGGLARFMGDRAGLAARFDRAMESLHVVFQPIVSWSRREVFAYEALLRSHEPSLPHPGAILDAAEKLGRVHDLGRRIRSRAIEPIERLPDDVLLFVNLHPNDLLDEHLFVADSPLAALAPRVVLEITERAPLDSVGDLRERLEALRSLGFRIAVDDLGAGYAGLTSLATVAPEVVKLDMSLIRGLDGDPRRQTVVRTMVSMSKELGFLVTGEGIETEAERDALARTGCDLMQGYLFAKPGDAFAVPAIVSPAAGRETMGAPPSCIS